MGSPSCERMAFSTAPFGLKPRSGESGWWWWWWSGWGVGGGGRVVLVWLGRWWGCIGGCFCVGLGRVLEVVVVAMGVWRLVGGGRWVWVRGWCWGWSWVRW